MMSPPRLAAVLLPLLLPAAIVTTAQDRPHAGELWLKVVEIHEPGLADPAAHGMGGMATPELRAFLDAIARLAERGAMNDTLERGAWFHADIAMLVPGSGDGLPLGSNQAVPALLGVDGRSLGTRFGSRHVAFGRALLRLVKPTPIGNDAARNWYQAVSTFLVSRFFLAEAVSHLAEARELFGGEAWVELDLGCLNETLAAPRVQQAVRFSNAPSPSPDLAEGPTHLARAERHFRQALAIDPGLVEARLRLGRVLGLAGRHEVAVRELGAVIDAAPDPVLQYYAHLFLGHEQEALGRPDTARDEYERAAALYPGAQAPYLAISRLAGAGGDAAAALDVAHRILEVPADDERRDDPWWTYHMGRGRDADAIVDAARRRAVGGGGQ